MTGPAADLAAARTAFDEGRRQEAKALLLTFVQDHREYGEAWYLLSRTTRDFAEQSFYRDRMAELGYTPPPGSARPPLSMTRLIGIGVGVLFLLFLIVFVWSGKR